MRHAPLRNDDRARRAPGAPRVTFRVFSITLSARPGSSVEITPTFFTLKGRDAHDRLLAACAAATALIARASPATANGMIFTVAIILPGFHRREGGQRRERDRRIDIVQRIDAALSTTSTPALSANRLARPVNARSMHALARDGGGDAGRGGILGHIARFEPRDDDLGNPARPRAPRSPRRRSACPS